MSGVVAHEADLWRAEGAMNFSYRVCSENAEPERDYDFSKCQKESEKTNEAFLQHSWASAALVALVPLPLFWLLAYQLLDNEDSDFGHTSPLPCADLAN